MLAPAEPIDAGRMAYDLLREEVNASGQGFYPEWDDLTQADRDAYRRAENEALITKNASSRFAALCLEVAGVCPVA